MINEETKKKILAEVEPGLRAMAKREVDAENNFTERLVEDFGITIEQAHAVLRIFIRHKVVKLDRVNGRYDLKSGIFWDEIVVQNALKMASGS